MADLFWLQNTLVNGCIPAWYLEKCIEVLPKKHYQEVMEERAVDHLCGNAACGTTFEAHKGKFRVSLKKKKMYEASQEKLFCSDECQRQAFLYLARLSDDPPQLRPSLKAVFGTSEPDPFTKPASDNLSSSMRNLNLTASAPRQVWAKQGGTVKERVPPPVTSSAAPAPVADVRERIGTDQAPTSEKFPTPGHATLIEGFAFSSKHVKRAKQMEYALQNDGNLPPGEVMEADSCNESSDDDLMSDDDEVLDLNPERDLPYFANLWRKLADWATNDTRLWTHEHVSNTSRSTVVVLGHYIRSETSVARYNAFCQQLQTALDSVLPLLLERSEHRACLDKLLEIARTFAYHESICSKTPSEWLAIATVLISVVYGGGLQHNMMEHCLKLSGITQHELQVLIQIFTDAPDVNESTVEESSGDNFSIEKTVTNHSVQEKQCRRCRRRVTVCRCDDDDLNNNDDSPEQHDIDIDEICSDLSAMASMGINVDTSQYSTSTTTPP